MSVFDKLKAYSRKPAAVILATVMATSTIPTTPIAQAVTAAYAEESSQGNYATQQDKGTEEKITAADLGIKETPWDGQSNIDLKFSTHIDNGEATATISADAVKALVNTELKKSSYDDQFKYSKHGQDDLSKAIDARLGNITTKNGLPEDSTSTSEDGKEKTETKYSNPVYREGSMTREVTGCKVELASTDGANSFAKVNDDGSITVKTDKQIDGGTISLKVTQLSLKVGFAYNYTKTVTKTPVSDSADSGSTGNNGGFSIDVGTVDGGNTNVSGNIGDKVTHTEETVDNDSKAIADVTLDKVTSGYGAGTTVATGQLSAKEYYDDTFTVPETVPVDDLTYKSQNDRKNTYDLKVSHKGLTPSFDKDANKDFFGVSTAGANTTDQTITFDPIKAFNNDETDKCDSKDVTISWLYPNGKPSGKTTTVTVSKIARAPITVSVGSQDFRIKDKQEENVKDEANKALISAIATFNKDDGAKVADKQYYKKAVFERYDTQGGDQDLTVSYPEIDNSGIFQNYSITDPTAVHVNAIQSIDWTNDNIHLESIHNEGDDEIILTAKKDEKNAGHDEWVKKRPVARWEGHSFASVTDEEVPETADGFKGWTAPETNGEQKQTILALDNNTGVVVRVPVEYKLDTTPVTASSIKYGGARQKRHGNIVFSDKSFNVNYQLVAGASGINSTDVSYHDNKSNSNENGVKPTTNGGLLYSFEVKGDRELDTDKINIHAVSNSGMALKTTAAEIKGGNQISENVAKLIAESSGPQVAISYSDTNPQRTANGKAYYNHSRSVRITVTDPFFKYTREYAPQTICEITRDGANFATVTTGDNWHQVGSSDEWYVDIPMTADGDYIVGTANVYDVIGGDGHTSSAAGEEFVVDQTAPKLNVSWNNEAASNGKYYNAARTATITVEEHNFDPNLFKIEAPVNGGNGSEATPAQIGGWSSNGDTHTATVTFPGQGVYSLSVSGEDLATNKSESYTSPEFVIDTIKPKIDIQNVINRTAYAGDVAPSAAVHDTNLADGTTIEVSKISYPLSKDDPNPYAGAAINTSATDKSVSYLNPAKTKGNDGVYTLTVQAVDLAGNTESEAVTWSVNRFGSTYVISDKTGKMLDKYLKSDKTVDVKVTEINPSGLDDNKTAVELTHDTKNSTLKNGDNYTTDSDTTSGWSEYNYTVKKGNYGKDGAYRVLFHSQDTAGNSSENTMQGKNAKKSGSAAEINFAVDDTAPIASFIDLDNNGKYEESSHKAKVSFEDNLKLAKAQIKVNGKVVATFTGDQLEKNPVREFTLDGSSSKQDVSVVAWDAAGNRSKELKATGVLVTNDSLVLWMNNLPMMIGTIAAVVIVAGGIWFVVAKKRKENEGEEA